MIVDFKPVAKSDVLSGLSTPDFDLKPADLSGVQAVDGRGNRFCFLPSTFNSTTSAFAPNGEFTYATLIEFNYYPPTGFTFWQLADPGGSSRRRLKLNADSLSYEEVSTTGATSVLSTGAQNRFVPKLNKKYLLIIANSGNKSYLYIAPEDGSMFELDCAYGGTTKVLTTLFQYGGLRFYRAVGYNTFIYNLTSLVSAFSNTYNLNTQVLPATNLPVLQHEWHFTDDATQYDMIGSENLTRNGTFSRVSSQFQGADQAVAGGYFSRTFSTAISGDFVFGMRFRMPTSVASAQALVDFSSIIIVINTSRQLELYAGGSSFVNTSFPLDASPGSESEIGWYQIFLHRVGNNVALYPEFEAGGSVTPASAPNLSSMTIGATLSGTQQFAGRLAWAFIKRGTLTAANKSALSSMTAPNMGTTTAHGRPVLGMGK